VGTPFQYREGTVKFTGSHWFDLSGNDPYLQMREKH